MWVGVESEMFMSSCVLSEGLQVFWAPGKWATCVWPVQWSCSSPAEGAVVCGEQPWWMRYQQEVSVSVLFLQRSAALLAGLAAALLTFWPSSETKPLLLQRPDSRPSVTSAALCRSAFLF